MRAAARQIARKKIVPVEILEQLQKGLQQHYLRTDADRTTIDALAWYCKILGKSNDPTYLQILEQVSKSAAETKLKRYAAKSLELLRKNVKK